MSTNDNTSFSFTRLLFALIFMTALLLPLLLDMTGLQNAVGKPKQEPQWPGLQTDALLDSDYYRAWVQYARSRLGNSDPLFRAKNWIDYRVFAMTESEGVHVGRNGWLFDAAAVRDFRKDGCRLAPEIQRLILSLRASEKVIEAAGRRFIFTVAPSKSTIYPEYLGALPQESECGLSAYDIFLAAMDENPLDAFVRLDTILTEAKASQRLLYSRTGTGWNADGARVAAHMLMQRLIAQPLIDTDDDLTPVILGPPTMPVNDENAIDASARRQRSTAVIYGGQALNQLLPYLQPRFERIDVIASASMPSRVHDEDLSAYDTIILVLSEGELSAQGIDLDLMGRSLDAEAMADDRRPIALEGVSAGNQMAVRLENDHLVIKSMGAEAYCTLPPVPGSGNQSLRMLQLDLTAPLNDILNWSMEGQSVHGGTRTLRTGENRLYLPLPDLPELQMRIHTGENAGIFRLQSATLLTFGDVGELESESAPVLSAPPLPPAIDAAELPAYEAPPSPETASRIELNDFEFKQVFQRRGTASDVFVAGTFQGAPGSVEARVLDFETDEIVMPWTVVDPAPDNGIFMGTLPGVPQGGWYRLTARFSQQPEIMTRGQSPWGVGMLVACIGQSNMKEWFHTGSPTDTHHLMSIHRNGKWIPMEDVGSGAAAFGQWLIPAQDLPVGLLDYAVNGSGLHPKADWGAGYWADRSKGGIYQRFIDDAAAAGGAMEYIIWMQGEADAARKTVSGHQYLHVLEDFITQQVRRDIGNGSHKANLPFLIVGMVKRPVGADAPHQAIRNALVAATREVDDTYLAATTLDLKLQGRQHLAPEAYASLGRRVAQTILSLLGKTEYYRGPSIASIVKIDDATIDLFLTHRGGNDFGPHTRITGFELFRDDSPVQIKSINRQSERSLRIQLDAPLGEKMRLTYLYGARPDTRGAVYDNSELQLPLEPFEAELE